MGQTVACSAKIDGKADAGTALLETDEVIFRGARARARVPFASMKSIAVDGEWLAIEHAGGSLALSLGARAETWLGKIRKPKGIVEKLGVKAGARVALVDWTDDDLAAGLEAAGARVKAGTPRAEVDVVLFGVGKIDDLKKLDRVTAKLAKDGALWIVRPKGKGGVPEDVVRDTARGAGFVDVKVARYSDTHTAEKFVLPLARR